MAINPRISSFIEDDRFLKFTLSDCNVSVANSIRRVILSDIPTFIFRTFPYSENKAEIYVNTSRLNNEILKLNDEIKQQKIEKDLSKHASRIKIIKSY